MIIVEIYVQDEEIKNIMQVYDLTENDFQDFLRTFEITSILYFLIEYQSAKNKTPLSLYSNYLILFEKTAGPFFFRKTIQFGKAD